MFFYLLGVDIDSGGGSVDGGKASVGAAADSESAERDDVEVFVLLAALALFLR